jgi:hypothetical protein
MTEAVSTSETSVNFCETTQRNIPEDCHSHSRENLKSHLVNLYGRLLCAAFGDSKPFESRKPSDSFIALMMEAISTSETSVNFCETTRRSIQENCHLLKYPVGKMKFSTC